MWETVSEICRNTNLVRSPTWSSLESQGTGHSELYRTLRCDPEAADHLADI